MERTDSDCDIVGGTTGMEQWMESIYSDGTDCFISNPQPGLYETVTISLRVYEDAPVRHVFLRTLRNGEEELLEARRGRTERGLVYYEVQLQMTEYRMHYHFYIVSDDVVYFYNQKEITTYIPDHTYDFVLLADYKQPEWVKRSVFYQIFPERFCNGNPENDVKDGEYELDGHPAMRIADWEEPPKPYEQAFCVDFYGGDLDGIREKIPYLKELGINALYLNPIFLSPSVHKYDCIDYFHVDPHFGGDEALARLSAALHENDMKLMLDISINHTGTAHRWFNRDGLYFDKTEGAYNNPESKERSYYFFDERNDYLSWQNVKSMPVLNYTSDELREIIYRGKDSVLRKWLKPPYSIDGWRFDVADVFGRNNELQMAHELWTEICQSIREENPQAYIIAEDWGDCASHLQGKEWDSPMNYYGCARVVRQFVGEPDLFMSRNPILREIHYKMKAEDLQARVLEHLGKLPYVMWQNQFNLLDSHDVSRLHNNPAVHPEEYRGAVMLLFTLTGTASVYYGDEAEIDGTLGTFEGCRYPMPWGKPFTESETYQMYQKLAHLKTNSKALADGGMKFLYAKDGIVAVARFYQDEILVTVMSVSDRTEKIILPFGSIGSSGPKSDRDLFGRKLEFCHVDEHHVELVAEPHQAYLIEG